MLITFTGNPINDRDDASEITFWGVTFPLGVPVHAPAEWSAEQRRKIVGNNHFRVETDGVIEAPVAIDNPAETDSAPVKTKRGKKAAANL